MTVSKDDLVKAVYNLNELTRDQKIKWKECSPSAAERVPREILSNTLILSMSYCVEYGNGIFRITETQWVRSAENIHQNYFLEIIDKSQNVLYKFPDVQGIADLYQSVRFQMADVEDIIKSLANTRQ